MDAIDSKKRAEFGRLLEHLPQSEVMARIPQFEEALVHATHAPTLPAAGSINALVFNMERGTHCDAVIDFLKFCPHIQPFDLILANELDDGCTRSGGQNVAHKIASALHMHYVFALEFIELTQKDAEKGFHGNAIFSRYPIKWAKTLHLPEPYNWYFDPQRRIGGRCAVFAEIDYGGCPIGIVSIHLENRTNGQGRLHQMRAIYEEALRLFDGMPVLLGGDLNTNAFDGRNKSEIQELAQSPELLQQRLDNLADHEPLLSAAASYGFEYAESACPGATRRKPLPDGSILSLRLDWFLSRGLTPVQSRNVSTQKSNCDFAPDGSALANLQAEELSDHNAVWARYRL